ncbi:MAG: rhomboid family intramembrane serine protease [Thermoplasmatales archaeon]|nr:rhomboid family intramembrane serine protease [Thermoplasmatales archaeon]
MAVEILFLLIIIIPLIYGFIKRIPISLILILLNIIIFIITIFYRQLVEEFAFTPYYLRDFSRIYTIFTSLFIHGDFYHLISNMIGLFFIGYPFENEIGQKKFFLVYFLCGFFSSIAFSVFSFGNHYLIGASGAIFGLLGAFAALYPMKRIVVPMPFIFVGMPVLLFAIIYASIETLYTFAGITDGIAHSAHIGGFVAGVLFAPFLRKKFVFERSFNIDKLEGLLQNERQRKIFERAKEAKEKEIREAWIKYLLKEIRCPECGGEIEINGGIKCKKCGYRK